MTIAPQTILSASIKKEYPTRNACDSRNGERKVEFGVEFLLIIVKEGHIFGARRF